MLGIGKVVMPKGRAKVKSGGHLAELFGGSGAPR